MNMNIIGFTIGCDYLMIIHNEPNSVHMTSMHL